MPHVCRLSSVKLRIRKERDERPEPIADDQRLMPFFWESRCAISIHREQKTRKHKKGITKVQKVGFLEHKNKKGISGGKHRASFHSQGIQPNFVSRPREVNHDSLKKGELLLDVFIKRNTPASA